MLAREEKEIGGEDRSFEITGSIRTSFESASKAKDLMGQVRGNNWLVTSHSSRVLTARITSFHARCGRLVAASHNYRKNHHVSIFTISRN